MKRRLLIFAWALASFCSGFILCRFGLILLITVYYLVKPSFENGPIPELIPGLLIASFVFPFLFSAYAFHLAYQGKLPGTRTRAN